MMTSKAHALGMHGTHFANASGLPNSEQITTAHDLAVLGRAIQDRFPHYYRYFSTHTFAYRGAVMRNHNHLLGQVEGMDGIKTGYTAASGFNLLTSVRRGGHHIVAVVLGGASAGARDRYMANLIEDHIDGGAGVRTAAAITEDQPAERVAAIEPEQAPAPAPVAEREVETNTASSEDAAEKPAPRARKQAAAAPIAGEEKARPAFVSGGKKQTEDAAAGDRKPRGRERVRVAAVDGSTTVAGGKAARRESVATTTPSALKHNDPEEAQLTKFDGGRPAHTGWMIQLGATDDAGKANELLTRARSAGHALPPGAKAFTEKVRKGNETLYRARFAGLEEQSAESACKTLKRSGFSCFATKN
jgi:D-alanyl-D-alanine carboxypeptidase